MRPAQRGSVRTFQPPSRISLSSSGVTLLEFQAIPMALTKTVYQTPSFFISGRMPAAEAGV